MPAGDEPTANVPSNAPSLARNFVTVLLELLDTHTADVRYRSRQNATP